MDPNQTNLPQNDTPQSTVTQQPPVPTQPEVSTANQSDSNSNQPQQTTIQTDQNTQTNSDASPTNGSYTEDFGNYIIELLDDIDMDEELIQIVADKMQLNKEKVQEILTKLLEKIDQEQITSEELALIMTSTVVDENSNNE